MHPTARNLARSLAQSLVLAAFVTFSVGAFADEFSDTLSTFRKSNLSGSLFRSAYGYAVFPTIGEGGFVVAGAHGTGRVYAKGRYVGDTTMTQISVGPQIGGQAYSQVLFFRTKQAFDRFTSGNFEFSADASAVAATAAADASAGTQGANAGLQTTKNKSGGMAAYRNDVAVFTIVKGGAMLQAAVGGQKFTYAPK